MAVIGSAAGFYIATTLTPGIDLIRLIFCIHPEVQVELPKEPWAAAGWKRTFLNLPQLHYPCPYKSPQAWAIFRLLVWFVTSPFPICRKALSYHLKRKFYKEGEGIDIPWVIKRVNNLVNWSSTDLEVVQRFLKIEICPDMYVLKAYRWLVQEFRDNPAMIPHLQALLEKLPPRLVMPTVLDSEIVRADRDWHAEDVEKALRRGPQPWGQEFEYSNRNMRFLLFHNMWIQHRNLWARSLACIPESELIFHLPWNRQRAPLTRILQLVAGTANEQRLVLEGYLKDIMTNNKIGSGWNGWDDIIRCLPQCVEALAAIPPDNLSYRELLYQFLLWIQKGVVRSTDLRFTPFTEAYALIDAFDTFRVAHSLPLNYFKAIPSYFPISMDCLSLLPGDSSPSAATIGSELLEECKRVWGTHKIAYPSNRNSHSLFDYLTRYILAHIPHNFWEGHVQDVQILEWVAVHPKELTKGDVPYILTCKDGLSLLKFLELSTEWGSYNSNLLGAWRFALECVAHINGVHPDYFTNGGS
ncbi:hypothetical protein V5O48_012977 [Marasmius crinis-equi]|uniref:Uncharacterized protein n=1 Tax=Marasmius crinis-equi TaxID=585013 RepID=A0ABR3F1D0_9AGAR